MPQDATLTAPLRLVQITDTHLFTDAGRDLVGMNCEEGFHDVLDLVRSHEGRPPEKGLDAVLCTGDLSQDGSEASYRRFHAAAAVLGAQQYWIPGNHDDPAVMRRAVDDDTACLSGAFSLPGWHVVLLDSRVAGRVHGRLADTELLRLDAELQAAGERHALVCLHHNSMPVDAAWLQRHALQNSEALFEVLDRHRHVKAVVCGHIHQELWRERNGVPYLGTPSTCVQFHPTHDDFALHDVNPGYRWFELFPDGKLRTGIRRVEGKRYPIDFSGAGY